MNLSVLRDALRTHPFRPFVIRVADGRAFPVPHPELVAASPRQVVHISPEDEALSILDPLMIVSLDQAAQTE